MGKSMHARRQLVYQSRSTAHSNAERKRKHNSSYDGRPRFSFRCRRCITTPAGVRLVYKGRSLHRPHGSTIGATIAPTIAPTFTPSSRCSDGLHDDRLNVHMRRSSCRPPHRLLSRSSCRHISHHNLSIKTCPRSL